MFFRKKRDYSKEIVSLLPHERSNLYGFNRESAQILGWHISKFNIDSQWKLSTGKGVVVAVIDTGCDMEHPDLKENLLPGVNLIDYNKPPQDDNGHGSHVCGTIAGLNNGFGVVGVAPESKILPIKALDGKGRGSLANIFRGIEIAIENKVDFITMSLGSAEPCNDLDNLLQKANKEGIIAFCAAGNSGENTDVSYPARYDSTISIGAIDENLDRTHFTCSGESLDFLAPGHNIISTVTGGYATMSGTSMSNPFAVGIACLLKEFNSRYNKFDLKRVDDYIDVLKKQVIEIPDSKYRSHKYSGYGILNLDLSSIG